MTRVTVTDGATYIGQVNANKQPHGEGTLTFLSGFTYNGMFREGQAYRPGIVKDPYGQPLQGYHEQEYLWKIKNSVYKGDYLNGMRSGYGRQIWSDGFMYEGFHVKDWLSGVIVKTSSDGSKSIELWVDNVMKQKDQASQQHILVAGQNLSEAERRWAEEARLKEAEQQKKALPLVPLLPAASLVLTPVHNQIQDQVFRKVQQSSVEATQMALQSEMYRSQKLEFELVTIKNDYLTEKLNNHGIVSQLTNEVKRLQDELKQTQDLLVEARNNLQYHGCKQCGGQFVTAEDLTNHRKQCASIQCPICDMVAFNALDQFITHMDSHKYRFEEQ